MYTKPFIILHLYRLVDLLLLSARTLGHSYPRVLGQCISSYNIYIYIYIYIYNMAGHKRTYYTYTYICCQDYISSGNHVKFFQTDMNTSLLTLIMVECEVIKLSQYS